MSYEDDDAKPQEEDVSPDAVDAMFDEGDDEEDEAETDEKDAFGDDGDDESY